MCMASKYMTRCAPSLLVREDRPYQTQGRVWGSWNPHSRLVGMQNGTDAGETSLTVSHKVVFESHRSTQPSNPGPLHPRPGWYKNVPSGLLCHGPRCKQLLSTRESSTCSTAAPRNTTQSYACTHDDASPRTEGGDRDRTKGYIPVIDNSSKFMLHRSDKMQIGGVTEEGAVTRGQGNLLMVTGVVTALISRDGVMSATHLSRSVRLYPSDTRCWLCALHLREAVSENRVVRTLFPSVTLETVAGPRALLHFHSEIR